MTNSRFGKVVNSIDQFKTFTEVLPNSKTDQSTPYEFFLISDPQIFYTHQRQPLSGHDSMEGSGSSDKGLIWQRCPRQRR